MSAILQARRLALSAFTVARPSTTSTGVSSVVVPCRNFVLGSQSRSKAKNKNYKSRGANALRKPEEQVMTTASGVLYPGTPEFLSPARAFVDGWSVPDKILLQAMTHKSFAHGRVPYNEKLVLMGLRIMQMETSIALLDSNQDFELNTQHVDRLCSANALSYLSRKANLTSALFFRNGSSQLSSGQDKISASAVLALVGAVYHCEGLDRARDFVQQRILAPGSPAIEAALASDGFTASGANKSAV